MFKRMMLLVFSGMLMFNLCGCFAAFLAGGVAGGAGAAMWISGRLTQQFPATLPDTTNAAKSALQQLNLPVTKESEEADTAQLRSTYTDGRDIWIDIKRVSDHQTRVDVRVGVKPDKEADSVIMNKIQNALK